MNRRMSSRSVSLTSTFLLLAAGGVAACDNGDDTQEEGFYCADANGNVQVNQVQQDGFPAGQLQSVSVSDRGRIGGSGCRGRVSEGHPAQEVTSTPNHASQPHRSEKIV